MVSVLSRLRAAAVAVAATTVLLTAAPRAQTVTPPPLGGVAQLKAWFNANKSHAKAILLLSPT